jgi:ribosomal protein L24E
MTLATWIQQYEDDLDLKLLAVNQSPKLIPYLETNPDLIDWYMLSTNSVAIELLKKNKNCIHWSNICLNPHPDAIGLIRNHHEHYINQWVNKHRRIPYDMMLSWENLSQNTSAIEFLEEYPFNELWSVQEPPYDPQQDDPDYAGNVYFETVVPDYQIDWTLMSQNAKGIQLLQKNPEKIMWDSFSNNTDQHAIELLRENPDKINWYWASQNPEAIDLLESNPDKIVWSQLSKNLNAIPLLKSNPEQIDWTYLSANPNAIELLEANLEKIDWRWLCKNPNAGRLLATHIEKVYDKLDWQWLSANPCIFI